MAWGRWDAADPPSSDGNIHWPWPSMLEKQGIPVRGRVLAVDGVLSEAGVSHALSINCCGAGSCGADLGPRGWGWRQVHWEKPAQGRVGGNRFPQELGTNLAPWGRKTAPGASPTSPLGWERGRGAQPFPAQRIVLPREPPSEPAQGPGCHAGRTGGDPVGQHGLGAGTAGGLGWGWGASFCC